MLRAAIGFFVIALASILLGKKSPMLVLATLFIGFYLVPAISNADFVTQGSAEKKAAETRKVVKKDVRLMKDEACEMVNGKMQCAKKKIEHKVENLKDTIESK